MTTSGITRRGALRMFGIGALGVAGAGALGACAPSGAGTSSGGDTKSKNFDFTSWSLNEEAAKPSIEKIIAAWEKAEGSKVRAVSYPYNEYLSQLTLKLGGGRRPARCTSTSPGSPRWRRWASSPTSVPWPSRAATRMWHWTVACTTASSTACRGTPARSV